MSHVSNLQALKLLGAFLVLIRHSLILFGDQSPAYGVKLMPIGIWIFLAISGYLLPRSWERNPNLTSYFTSRAARIFPAFFIVVLASAFLLGPVFSKLSIPAYFSHWMTWKYFLNLLLHPIYFLPAVFEDNYYPNAVNGSLWSIPPQVLAYALVPLILLIPKRLVRIGCWTALLGVSVWGGLGGGLAGIVLWGNELSQVSIAIAVFLAAALLRELRVPLHLGFASLFLVILIVTSFVLPGMLMFFTVLFLPYIVMSVGLRSWKSFTWMNRLPDVSYGVFLVGFPVQQALIAAMPALHPLPSIILAAAVSTLIAIVIQRYVERPVQRYISRLRRPRRSHIVGS